MHGRGGPDEQEMTNGTEGSGPRQKAAKQGRARISEVARLAEVSTATVSRTLANPQVVAPETRERVLEAVRQTGYTPNVVGRSLRARRSMMVLVVVPTLANPFYADVLRGIDHELWSAGYGLIVGNLDNSIEKESRLIDVAYAGQVDGVLLLNGRVPESEGRMITAAGIAVAGAVVPIPGAVFPQALVDDHAASREVAKHLVELGHERFGYVSGPPGVIDAARSSGFLSGLGECGHDPELVMQAQGDFSFAAGFAAAGELLQRRDRPTAVYAIGDAMAVGFVKGAHKLGLSIPTDVAVVGFDGLEFADYCEPVLTTVVQPRKEMGCAAARLLVEQMLGTAKGPGELVWLQAPLLVRESTATPRRAMPRSAKKR
jgi:LacI family repressor for deo operon, udp, cdd, tsx, nupC, and nupG